MTPNLYWLALSRAFALHNVVREWLLAHSIEQLFAASDDELRHYDFNAVQIRQLRQLDFHKAKEDLLWCEAHQCQLIHFHHALYPQLLREIHKAPLLLYVQGEVALLREPQLAMVGTRNPTVTGVEVAQQFAQYLARAGLVITSGLALGVDGVCHQATLDAQGKTVAVLGTGLQRVYPLSHKKLAREIIARGALVAEFPLDSAPVATHFPMRNRIISGLSLGVLVVEAAVRSGSLITARFALEQNRDVFAIPGSIHNPLARGCHQLIRQGAKLVETAEDVLEELSVLHSSLLEVNQTDRKEKALDLSVQNAQLLAKIGYEVTPLDVIMRRSGLTSGELSSILLSLELAGYLHAVPSGYLRVK